MRIVFIVCGVKTTALEDNAHAAAYEAFQLATADRTGFHRFVGNALKVFKDLFALTALVLICRHVSLLPLINCSKI
jgi:hypothetical protein